MKQIGIIAEFNPNSETHLATIAALKHSSEFLCSNMTYKWISTEQITPETIDSLDGILLCTGTYRSASTAINLITQARNKGVPLLGTCSGFQHIILELGKNILGYVDAAHEEYTPNGSTLLITKLTCSLVGREMKVEIERDSKVFSLYKTTPVVERYYCSYGVNPDFVEKLDRGNIRIVASDSEGIVRAIELTDHPFFIGTLYVPQSGSKLASPHPIINGFVMAVEQTQK